MLLYYKNKKEIKQNLESISYSSLKQITSKYKDKKDPRKEYKELISKPDFTTGPYKIYKVTTIDQCLKVGKGTSWCIQGKQWAKKYLSKGPLWLVMKMVKSLLY